MNNAQERELRLLFEKYDSMLRYAQLHKGEVEPSELPVSLDLTEEEYEYVVDTYLQQENVSFSLIAAEEAINKYPYSCSVVTQYCEVLVIDNQLEKAEEILNRYTVSFGMNSEIAIGFCRLHIKKGEIEKAKEYYRQAMELESFPEDLCDAVYILAKDCADKMFFNEAIALLDKAMELTQKWSEKNGERIAEEEFMKYYVDYAYCYESLKEYDRAIEFINKALDINAFHDQLWFLLGEEYLNKGEEKENLLKAKDAFEFAWSLNKAHTQALLEIGIINLMLDNPDAAIETFNSYCKADSGNPMGYLMLASAYISKNDYKQAKFLYHKVLALNPKDKEALKGLDAIKELEAKEEKRKMRKGKKDLKEQPKEQIKQKKIKK